MKNRDYINYSADELIVCIERNKTNISVLKTIIHEISFRKKSFIKLEPHLRKAEVLISKHSFGNNSAGLSIQDDNCKPLFSKKYQVSHEAFKNKGNASGDLKKIKNLKLEDLNLRLRDYHCLKASGVQDLQDLLKIPIQTLLKIPNFGICSRNNINALLEGYGLTLGMSLNLVNERLQPHNIQQISAYNLKVRELYLNVREENCLLADGIDDLKTLVGKNGRELLRIPNFGKASLARVDEALKGLDLTLGMKASEILWKEQKEVSTADNIQQISAYNLKVRELYLNVREENCLLADGIDDLKTLVGKNGRELLRIPNFGKASLARVDEALKGLDLTLGMKASEILWKEQKEVSTADNIFGALNCNELIDFGGYIGQFVEQYSNVLQKESLQLIFIKRIVCITKDIPTLEVLGQEIGVTRERVRQVEKKIIRELIDVIFGVKNFGGMLNLNPTFIAGWKKVAISFDGEGEISNDVFVSKLVSTWDISQKDLRKYFNFICVIFTGKVKSHLINENSFSFSKIIVYREKFRASLDTKISHFRLGKCTQYFTEIGVFTIGDFLYSQSFNFESIYFKKLMQSLEEQIVSDEGVIDWIAFVARNDFDTLGKSVYEDSFVFVEELQDLIVHIIKNLNVWTNSEEVFLYRTSKHPANRPTLKMAAEDILGKPNHGPVISRIQAHFLEKLRQVIIDKDYSNSKFWLAKGVLDCFSKARELYDFANGDFDRFVYIVSMRWRGAGNNIDNISILWTIIDGYTPKRYFHLELGEARKRNTVSEASNQSINIKLAGFRKYF